MVKSVFPEDSLPAVLAVTLDDFKPQEAVYQSIIRSLADDRFVHACLISGIDGVGKKTLAGLIAQSLVCSGASGASRPCGVCPECRQIIMKTHPDYYILQPGVPINKVTAKGAKSIPVDDIRTVNATLGVSARAGGRRVVAIYQADTMTSAAQNSLLKTLEEPKDDTVFLLLSSNTGGLLPTIISRCRNFKLHPWEDKYIMNVLRRSGFSEKRCRDSVNAAQGSIGRALTFAGDEEYWSRRSEILADFFGTESYRQILSVSEKWKDRKDMSQELLQDIDDILRTIMRVSLGAADESVIEDYPAAWKNMAKNAGAGDFVNLMEAVQNARIMRDNQVSIQAVLEKLLFRLMEEKKKWSV